MTWLIGRIQTDLLPSGFFQGTKDIQKTTVKILPRISTKMKTVPTATNAETNASLRHIEKVMKMIGGRVEGPNGAAEILGLKPGTLRHRMRKLGMPFGRKVKL
ncbi:MAG: hypothetical protein GY866_35175 [Proteobacteria bacterium]|nr:hypothetical protein [Pseudomonadota bacterium]